MQTRIPAVASKCQNVFWQVPHGATPAAADGACCAVARVIAAVLCWLPN